MPAGLFIIGGFGEVRGEYEVSTELMSPGASTWSLVTPLPEARAGHCATKISEHSFIVIGGEDSNRNPTNTAWMYNTWRGTWDTNWSSLISPRVGHSCAVVGGKLIITGGRNSSGNSLSSTEIIDLVPPFTARSTVNMNLNTARTNFGISFIGGEFNSLVAVGGIEWGGSIPYSGQFALASLEMFNPLTESWTISSTTLQQGRKISEILAVTDEIMGCSG
jgi:hypothetical protein